MEEFGAGLGDGVGGSWRKKKRLELKMKLRKIEFGDFKKMVQNCGLNKIKCLKKEKKKKKI